MDMKTRLESSLFLRVASVLTLLFAVGHTLGGKDSWSPVGETDVLRAMRSFRFDAGGAERTYLDFYLGFGYTLGVFLVLQAVLLWQLASIAKTDPLRIRPMIASLLVALIAAASLSWIFILPVPAISFAVIAVCLGLALLSSRRGFTRSTVTAAPDHHGRPVDRSTGSPRQQ
jgi:hypothetical protein